MSFLDKKTLRLLGVGLSGLDLELPMYLRKEMVPYSESGLSLHRSRSRCLSLQFLVSIVLQIIDLKRFYR